MREAGVGDLGVGKKIRKMAQAFYGRAAAYDEALGKAAPASDDAATRKALGAVLRNLYPDADDAADSEKLNILAEDLLKLESELADRTLEDIPGRSASLGRIMVKKDPLSAPFGEAEMSSLVLLDEVPPNGFK